MIFKKKKLSKTRSSLYLGSKSPGVTKIIQSRGKIYKMSHQIYPTRTEHSLRESLYLFSVILTKCFSILECPGQNEIGTCWDEKSWNELSFTFLGTICLTPLLDFNFLLLCRDAICYIQYVWIDIDSRWMDG